jgi:hypothetical protein
MPTLLDTITQALQDGARAGAAQASSAARDLRNDVEKFVVPHLEDIAVQVESIVSKRKDGTYTDTTTRLLRLMPLTH